MFNKAFIWCKRVFFLDFQSIPKSLFFENKWNWYFHCNNSQYLKICRYLKIKYLVLLIVERKRQMSSSSKSTQEKNLIFQERDLLLNLSSCSLFLLNDVIISNPAIISELFKTVKFKKLIFLCQGYNENTYKTKLFQE